MNVGHASGSTVQQQINILLHNNIHPIVTVTATVKSAYLANTDLVANVWF